MNRNIIAIKNMLLGLEFDKYVVEHPDFAKKIPQNATIFFFPQNDSELCQANLQLATRQKKRNVVFVRISRLAPLPKSRIISPKVELQPVL